MKKIQHEKSARDKNCNMKGVQHGKWCNMKRVHKRYNIKTLQHEKMCDMKRVHQEQSL